MHGLEHFREGSQKKSLHEWRLLILLAIRLALGESDGGDENRAPDWSVPLQSGTVLPRDA